MSRRLRWLLGGLLLVGCAGTAATVPPASPRPEDDPTAIDPRLGPLLVAIAEPGCPRLDGMINDNLRDAVGDRWAPWCAFVGNLRDLERTPPRKPGMQSYRGHSGKRSVLFDVAFDGEGLASGLYAYDDDSVPPAELQRGLDDELANLREAHHLPALAALVLREGRPLEAAVAGVRKHGDGTLATVDDRWHLGSNGKAMTATLAAILVAEKKLAWTSTVGEVLADWEIHPQLAPVTLEMLLGHRAGLPMQVPGPLWAHARGHSATQQRAGVVRAILRQPPGAVSEFQYSNVGYMVAATMLEHAAGAPWETLIGERLFRPLGMESCGFGAPATRGKVDQPWGHRRVGVGLQPVPPGPASDNAPAMGPSGTIHCSLADWGKFAQLHLDGELGHPRLVGEDEFMRLHTAPLGGHYALGWAVGERPNDAGKTLSHDGSNDLFFARIWLYPARNLAFLMATNVAGPDAEQAINQLTHYLVARHVDEKAK